jgi:hypothetical protein
MAQANGCVRFVAQGPGIGCGQGRARVRVQGDVSNSSLHLQTLISLVLHKPFRLLRVVHSVGAVDGLQREPGIRLGDTVAIAESARLGAIVQRRSFRHRIRGFFVQSVGTPASSIRRCHEFLVVLLLLPSCAAARSVVRVTPEEP